MQPRALLWALSVCFIVCYQARVDGAADARPSGGAAAAASGQSRLPPLIAALNALRPTITIGNSTTRSRPSASASSQAAPRAAGAGPPLDALRPAAAAALARQHSGPNAVPLSDDDIAAINILLGREEPPSRPYAYDTGLPATANNTTASVPHLLTFGNHTRNSNKDSSMQSTERLSKMSSLGPLSWLARQFHISGSTLLKLRITQQLQLILGDAISDSAASTADLPPNQVVTFASGNLSMSLGFTGVDWDDGLAAGAAAMEGGTAEAVSGLPHAGLVAVQKAIQELTGNFDPGHTIVSFEPPLTSSAAAAVKPATQEGPKQTNQPAAANSARKLLLQQHPQQRAPTTTSSSSSSRRLAAAGSPPALKVVYVQLFGMDPMNLTSLMDKLANCSAQQQPAAPGRMPEMPAGAPLAPWCADTFRKHFQQQGVAVAPGAAFKVSAQDKAAATIGLAVAIGVTQDQQVTAGTDTKAAAWLNGTSMQDIFGTFNLTVASTDADYVAYLRDKHSGLFPSLPGLNLDTLIPSLLQTVLAANRSGSQLEQQQQQKGSGSAALPAMNKAAMAGIIVAVVASVLALAGVVVLLLRRRSDSRGAAQQDVEGGGGAGPNRRRKRRPRLYHTKYLPDTGPVLGPEPQSDAPNPPPTAAAAADGPRHKLERGDSVTSQVHIEMDEAQDEEDDSQSSADAGSSSQGSSPSAAAAAALRGASAARHHSAGGGLRAHRPQQQHHQQQQQQQKQEGIGASGGSTVSTANSRHSGSTGSASVVLVPADSSAWGDECSGSMRTVSVDLTANSSSVLSPWESQGEVQGPAAAAAAGEGKQGRAGSAGSKHRLAVASQAVAATEQQQQQQGQGFDGCSSSSSSSRAVVGKQQQQLAAGIPQPAAAVPGSFSMASAFAAMDAQLAAAVRAGAVSHTGNGSRRSSGGGSMVDVQPLGMSAWHKGGHVSGFLVPEVAAASSGGGDGSGLAPLPPGLRRSTAGGGGGLVSPFAAAIQLANSVASDEV